MKSEYFEQLVKQTVRFRFKTHPNSIHPNSLLNKPKRKRLSTQPIATLRDNVINGEPVSENHRNIMYQQISATTVSTIPDVESNVLLTNEI